MSQITSADLRIFRSVIVADSDANGGKLSTNRIFTGVKNSIFPDVTENQRSSGIDRFRKTFFKNSGPTDLKLYAPFIHMTFPTPANDLVVFFPGTKTDIQSEVDPSRVYGAAKLHVHLAPGDTSVVVTLEHTDHNVFANADRIWISDGTNSEFHNNITMVKSGTQVTITLDSGDTIENTLSNTNTFVASVYQLSGENPSIFALADNFDVTSASGVLNEEVVTTNNVGTIDDTWTLTFVSATAFNYSNSNGAITGQGNITSVFAPMNTPLIKAYFSIPTNAWSGTFAVNDTVVFQTHSATIPIWFKKIVPAGTNSHSMNNFKFRFGGSSA